MAVPRRVPVLRVRRTSTHSGAMLSASNSGALLRLKAQGRGPGGCRGTGLEHANPLEPAEPGASCRPVWWLLLSSQPALTPSPTPPGGLEVPWRCLQASPPQLTGWGASEPGPGREALVARGSSPPGVHGQALGSRSCLFTAVWPSASPLPSLSLSFPSIERGKAVAALCRVLRPPEEAVFVKSSARSPSSWETLKAQSGGGAHWRSRQVR